MDLNKIIRDNSKAWKKSLEFFGYSDKDQNEMIAVPYMDKRGIIVLYDGFVKTKKHEILFSMEHNDG